MGAGIEVSVVTGAGGGLGGGIVETLLERGDRVIAADVDRSALERLRDRLRAQPITGAGSVDDALELVELDVTSAERWESLRETARERFGDPTVLVNNAGISPKHNGVKLPGTQISLDEWNAVIAVNLTGAFLGMQTLIPAMQRAGYGRIVNISSMAARIGGRIAGVHYSATKTGLLGLTRGFAWELAPSGITVNAVTPGRITLGMAQQTTEEVNARMLESIPVGRLGTPEDIGRMVVYLTGAENGFVTGATFDINGGNSML